MTPMIDIVFLLIIFFMTVSQISEINREPLELPRLRGAEDQQQSTLTFNVTAGGEVIVSGRRVTVPEAVVMTGDELARVDHNPARLSIVIRADQRGEARTVNEIVAALTRLGVQRVRVAVETPGG